MGKGENTKKQSRFVNEL